VPENMAVAIIVTNPSIVIPIPQSGRGICCVFACWYRLKSRSLSRSAGSG
jgi:hypothetical protein